MSKGFSKYFFVWLIFMAGINATAWIMPLIRSEMFWASYGIVNGAFVVQLLLSLFVFNQRKEISIPVFIPSFVSLIVLFIANAVGLYYFWPTWVHGVVSLIILALTYLLMLVIGQNSEKMLERDRHVRQKTDLMASIVKQVKSMAQSSGNKDIERLYEELRYTDKASKDPELELKIKDEINKLSSLKEDQIKESVDQIIRLVKSR